MTLVPFAAWIAALRHDVRTQGPRNANRSRARAAAVIGGCYYSEAARRLPTVDRETAYLLTQSVQAAIIDGAVAQRAVATVTWAAGNRTQANRLTASADDWEDIRQRTAFLCRGETDAYGSWTTMQELKAMTGGKDLFELTKTQSAYRPALGARWFTDSLPNTYNFPFVRRDDDWSVPMSRTSISVCVWLVALWLAMPVPVAAYLDPGTGSMFLQGAIAVIAATLAAAGVYWRSARDFIRRITGKTSTSDSDRPGKS
jgi:hypothetical protein